MKTSLNVLPVLAQSIKCLEDDFKRFLEFTDKSFKEFSERLSTVENKVIFMEKSPDLSLSLKMN